jgi:hypothetical protein
MKHISFQKLIFISVVILLSSCDQDVFNNSCKKIHDSFFIKKWEDGKTFYLLNSCNYDSLQGGGVINGTINSIWWNSEFIIVNRKSIFGGDKDGWIVINSKNASMDGPFENLEATKFKNIKTLIPSKAWESLK